MTQSDIILTFFTIVYGMMLLELGSRIHTLLRNRKIVEWHYLPLLSAWFILLLVLKNWWHLALSTVDHPIKLSIFEFVYFGHLLILFYLLTTSVLPDKIEKSGIKLKEFYFKNNNYFWGVFSLSLIMILFRNLYSFYSKGELLIVDIGGLVFFVLLSILLVFNRKTGLHTVVLSILILKNIAEIIALNP